MRLFPVVLAALLCACAPRLRLGLGDRFDQQVGAERVVVYRQAAREGLKFKYVALWLTPGWQSWLTKDELRQISRDGYTPLLLYYTLGDNASREYLEADGGARLRAWKKDIQDNLVPLLDIGSEVLVALEPEFNNRPERGTPLLEWPEWDGLAAWALDAIHAGAPRAKAGLCPGDWGAFDLEKGLRESARKSDFLAFPEMRASTDPSVDASSGAYLDAGASAVAYSGYLKKAFGKPILLAYLAVSSYAGADPRGWEDQQAAVLSGVFAREKDLLANGVFGLSFFAYYDDPDHEGFFGPAEREWGLKDAQGRPKKAWLVWKRRGR